MTLTTNTTYKIRFGHGTAHFHVVRIAGNGTVFGYRHYATRGWEISSVAKYVKSTFISLAVAPEGLPFSASFTSADDVRAIAKAREVAKKAFHGMPKTAEERPMARELFCAMNDKLKLAKKENTLVAKSTDLESLDLI